LKTIAAIDVGSNSILLSITRVRGKRLLKPSINLESTPRLSEGLKESRRISEQSESRLIQALTVFRKCCDENGVEQVSCCGTSALREATNAAEVIARARSETGIKIEVISGRREAALTYLGAVTGMRNLRRSRVLIDAGGGSSEAVVAMGTKVLSARSYKIGAVALTERLRTARKLKMRELDETLEAIRADVGKLKIDPVDPSSTLICSGGTPSAIQAFRIGMKEYDTDQIHGARMTLAEYQELVYELGRMRLTDRRRVLSFEPKRADVITAGGLLSFALAERTGIKSVRTSDRSLRFGMLYQMAGHRIEFA
jgi:exopolyphosphatase/guanosine-5'-triphosphate,3'-diphosphate pyrophosphatase